MCALLSGSYSFELRGGSKERERGMEEGRADIGKVSACVCMCVWRRGIELQASLSEDSEKLSEQGAKGQG